MSVSGKIRVLECIRQGQIGGGESHLLSLCEHLNRTEFEPVVLSFTDGPMIDRLKMLGVPTNIIYTERPFDILKWNKVKDLIEKQKVDLVHAHGTRASSNVLWAAKSLGIPVVYTIHGWSFHQDQHKLVQQIRIYGEKYLTKKSSLNISVSKSNQESGKKYISSFKSIVINNGIDLKKFNPAQSFKNIREELGIEKDKVLILFCARFLAQKQPISLIKSFSSALQKVPNMHLLMVGDGDQKAEAVELVKVLNLDSSVTFQPFRQDVPDILAASDIFVLPSLWEGMPIGLLEAMAMGKAVIATDVDGTNEVIENNVNGILIKTDNLIQNLQGAIETLAPDKALQKRFSAKAMETVQNHFDACAMTREIENAYKRVLKKFATKN